MNIYDEIMKTVIDDEDKREEARMRSAYQRLAMLKDDYSDLIDTKLRRIMSAETMKVMPGYINVAQNVYKAIISRLSRIYKTAPVRTFKSDSGESVSKDQSLKIEDMYADAKIDRKMKTANQFLNSVNEVFLMPVFREGKLCLDILTPDYVRVIVEESDPSTMAALLVKKKRYSEMTKKFEVYYVVWEPGRHYHLEQKGDVWTEVPIKGNEKMDNPYGVIPAIDVHRYSNETSFWDETSGDDLYNLNVVVGMRNTLLDFNSVWQSFKQVTVEGVSEAPPAGLTLSPDTILYTEAGASYNTLDLQANFQQLRGDLTAINNAVAMNYGVSLESFGGPTQQSGIALRINNQTLTDIIVDQTEIFEDAEERLWKLIIHVAEVDKIGKFNSELDIRFADLTLDTSKESYELDLQKMQDGILAPGKFYMKYNPSVTSEEEAVKMMQENLAVAKTLTPQTDQLDFDAGLDDELEE